MRLSISIPLRLDSAANLREHWSARHQRVAKQRADLALFVRRGAFPLPCVVTLTRVAPRVLDDDNLRGAFKAIRDQVAAQLGLADDRDPRVVWEYAQRKAAPKTYGIVIDFRQE